MIVKTIRWKTRSFNRLVDYIAKDSEREGSFAVLHNLRPGDLPGIAEQFRANDAYRKERANGVVLYHEILSVSPTLAGRSLAWRARRSQVGSSWSVSTTRTLAS